MFHPTQNSALNNMISNLCHVDRDICASLQVANTASAVVAGLACQRTYQSVQRQVDLIEEIGRNNTIQEHNLWLKQFQVNCFPEHLGLNKNSSLKEISTKISHFVQKVSYDKSQNSNTFFISLKHFFSFFSSIGLRWFQHGKTSHYLDQSSDLHRMVSEH